MNRAVHACLVAAVLAPSALAGTPCDAPLSIDEVVAFDGQPADRFGEALAIDGSYALVGAPFHDAQGTDSGAVYAYRISGDNWIFHEQIVPPDAAGWDQFGNAIAIEGDLAAIGAHLDDDVGTSSGSVYLYRRDTFGNWEFEAKLLPSLGLIGDRFGAAVAVSGDRVVVGAVEADADGWNAGLAYVFRRVLGVWALEGVLRPADISIGKQFGCSVSIVGETALVGAFYDTQNGSGAGAAYVFRRIGAVWVQEAKLLAADGAGLDLFGSAVALGQDVAVIGVPEDDDLGTSSGSAYVFRRLSTSWFQQQKLLPSGGSAQDKFGRAVTIDDDRAVVGAYWDDVAGTDSGAAYVFFGSPVQEWIEQTVLVAPSLAPGDHFGVAVAAANGRVIVGGPHHDANGESSGFAALFVLGQPGADGCGPATDVNGDGVVDVEDLTEIILAWGVCPLFTPCPADVDGDGVVDVADLVDVIIGWG